MRTAMFALFALTRAIATPNGSVLNIADKDLHRAQTKVPGLMYKGTSPGHTAQLLNGHLNRRFSSVRPCEEWSVNDLQTLQTKLFTLRQNQFNEIYASADDRRTLRAKTLGQLLQQWHNTNVLVVKYGDDAYAMQRDGHCYETVMWLIHHLTTEQQDALSQQNVAIPSLPQQHSNTECIINSDLCRVVSDQKSCLWCHSSDEGTGTDIPVPEPSPGHADTVAVFPHRWIANVSGTGFYNESGPGQSGKVSWESFNMTYYYDWPGQRIRQDTYYNDTYPAKSAIQWFNGTNQKWYIFDIATGKCIHLPPPIVTIQRPDFMMGVSNGTHMGQEQVNGHITQHWFASFIRVNPKGMKSNASFDLWLDSTTSNIVKLEGKCDPPDPQEGTPTDAVANYTTFRTDVTDEEMDSHFNLDTSKCWLFVPHPSSSHGLYSFHGMLPDARAMLTATAAADSQK